MNLITAKISRIKAAKTTIKCILLPIMLGLSLASNASANDTLVGGILDEPSSETAKGSGKVNPNSVAKTLKELQKEVKKEQKALEKLAKSELKQLAKNGERLAQVTLANDFADEAQSLTFAPVAANAALSDALSFYVLAAQRGYPGAPSLDNVGISFSPVRVVRNR